SNSAFARHASVLRQAAKSSKACVVSARTLLLTGGLAAARKGPSQVAPAHAGVVRRSARLELPPARERSDDDWIKAGILDQSCGYLERLRIVARKRNTNSIALSIRLVRQRFEIHRVERFDPSRGRKHRCCPACGALRMVPRVARRLSVAF